MSSASIQMDTMQRSLPKNGRKHESKNQMGLLLTMTGITAVLLTEFNLLEYILLYQDLFRCNKPFPNEMKEILMKSHNKFGA